MALNIVLQVTQFKELWHLFTTFHPVHDLKMTPLLQFTPIHFLKSTPLLLFKAVCTFGALLVQLLYIV